MRYIDVPPLGAAELNSLVASSQAARKYLRYYQRGLVGFAVATALITAVEHFLPADGAYDPWLWRSRVAVAIASVMYSVAPYSRKVRVLWRDHIRPLFDLTSDRR